MGVHREALVIFGTIIRKSLLEFIPLLTSSLRRKLQRLDPDELEDYLYDEVSVRGNLRLESGDFLYQPNNDERSKIYLVHEMIKIEEDDDEEFVVVKPPSKKSEILFNKYLKDSGITGELKQYLVYVAR